MAVLLKNNAVSRLAASIAASATAISVTAGDGAKYPAPGAGDWFPLTLIKADGTLEVLRCTSRSGDVLTVARAQEGTSALAFTSGDRVELRITAAALNTLFGGSASFPTLGGLELNSSAPYIDFHFGSSAADFTSRITADSASKLSIYSATGGLQASFDDTTFNSLKTITATAGVTSLNGGIRVRDAGSLAFSDYTFDGKVSVYNATPTLVTTGTIWHSGTFTPAGKITGDDCLIAGISAGVNPYMRRAADNSLFFLQTALGYTPVQQGTGVGQSTNVVKLGYKTAQGRLGLTIDSSDFGLVTTDDRVLPILSQQGVGGIGTYAFCYSSVAATPGAMIAGGNLLLGYAAGQGGTAPSGTWRCMGDTPAGGRTLFLRAT
jgi:hypothetical protein